MSTESNEGVKHTECLVCGKKLDCSEEFYGCTAWNTYGNYGSTEFDPCERWRSEGQSHLVCEAVICDECLMKKANVIRVVRRAEIEKISYDHSLAEWKENLRATKKKNT